jgi:hypothetical protein
MKNRLRSISVALVLELVAALPAGLAAAAAVELHMQSSAWFSLNDDKPSTPRLGLRFQPVLSLGKALGTKWKLDSEVSLNLFASGVAAGWRDPEFSGEIKPYRLWLRLSSARFEARLGLQKINFGSATVFRPLMWFDRIDPRDPLQITRGVYGLLLRYYFQNNANIWLWGLYGNPDAKGWETRPTADDTPEFGGRFQAPLFTGEVAATVHFRRTAAVSDPAAPASGESRFAIDGKWDLGVGLWVEASSVHQDETGAVAPWQRALTLGIDYTFQLGNGLYLLAEQFLSQGAASLLGRGEGSLSFAALVARYPLGLLDTLSTIIYYDWRNRQAYCFSSWQRTTDRWQFHVMVFWNPRQAQIFQAQAGNNLFGGKGFQLMAVCNL